MTNATNLDRTIAALADPTRRAVFEKLRIRPLPVGEIAAGMAVSRPAVSQHLKTLRQAGLVQDEPRGATRLYRIEAAGMDVLRNWIDSFWDDALARFKAHAEGENE
jgi:DNA-binding transcriptional ArsR family regulator